MKAGVRLDAEGVGPGLVVGVRHSLVCVSASYCYVSLMRIL